MPMEQSSEASARHPLSYTQQVWCRDEMVGNVGARFILPVALRVTGPVDLAVLQGALDDLVVRHEALRTLLVCAAEPPFQQVWPPSPVPLSVAGLPSTPVAERDGVARRLLVEAQAGQLDAAELPLLRAVLYRFDDKDSVLILITHHSVGDAWSVNVLKRDLGALYQARATGTPVDLPAPRQYREYAEVQRERVGSGAATPARRRWAGEMDGAHIFTMPTDRPDHRRYENPYTAANFLISEDQVEAVKALAVQTRGSVWFVLLATFYVLAHQISGESDVTVLTLTSGRGDRSFRDSVGLFVDFLPLRVGLDGCLTFRDLVLQTRKTCLESYSAEIPIAVIEQDSPELMLPIEEPGNMDFIFSYVRSVFGADVAGFADGARQVDLEEEPGGDVNGSTAWSMTALPSGVLRGTVQYPPDVFDTATVNGWTAEYRRLLAELVSSPDEDWRNR
jgi:hypothetical protein